MSHDVGRESVEAPAADRLAQGALAAAEAATHANERTIDAIERAAADNDDPVVADDLREAAANAETVASRVGWLRGLVRRLFG